MRGTLAPAGAYVQPSCAPCGRSPDEGWRCGRRTTTACRVLKRTW